MIKVDAYFTNGNVHKTCQDYALYGNDPIPYVIICDGCSSSRYTDVGARLIALSAKKILIEMINNDIGHEFFIQVFEVHMLIEMSLILKILEIDKECMDSTLIVSFIRYGTIFTFCFGDGQRLINYKSMGYHLVTISYEGNAPYYLSYQMDVNKGRDKIFKEYAKAKKFETRNEEIIINGVIENQKTMYNEFIIDKIPIEGIKSYCIMSDGTESFVNRETGDRVDHRQISDLFTCFKNTNGEFIKRRVRRAIDDLAKENIYNTDDISVAGFYFTED